MNVSGNGENAANYRSSPTACRADSLQRAAVKRYNPDHQMIAITQRDAPRAWLLPPAFHQWGPQASTQIVRNHIGYLRIDPKPAAT